MSKRRKLDGRIGIDEAFDDNEPMAQVVRSLLPAASKMDSEARERMMGHLFSVQRGRRLEGPKRETTWAKRALVPAVALVLVAAVLSAVLFPVFFGGGKTRPAVKAQNATFLNLVGKVEVMQPGHPWRPATSEDHLMARWSVRTGAASTASVHFPDGSVARLADDSEAKVTMLAAGEISIDHIAGGTYHRVHKGTKYTVTNSDVASHALGTAFNVENRVPGRLEILTVESAVEVSIGVHEPIKVSQGEVMTVSLSGNKTAEKQPVSRERLQDQRLMAAVQQDAAAGYSTGVYENLDVPGSQPSSQPAQTQPEQPPSIQLAGDDVSGTSVNLSWTLSGAGSYGSLVLLRSEGAEPSYPGDEIVRYSDTSVSSATDDTITAGHTYQYRIAGVPAESGEVIFSNTVVVDVASPEPQPVPASMSLTAAPSSGGVALQWSVTGANVFEGFVLERVVDKAPSGSPTPEGTTNFKRIKSSDVFYSYQDGTVLPAHSYSYRVGLVINGAVMVYSDWQQAAVPSR